MVHNETTVLLCLIILFQMGDDSKDLIGWYSDEVFNCKFVCRYQNNIHTDSPLSLNHCIYKLPNKLQQIMYMYQLKSVHLSDADNIDEIVKVLNTHSIPSRLLHLGFEYIKRNLRYFLSINRVYTLTSLILIFIFIGWYFMK